MNKKKVYLAGSMAGGRDFANNIKIISDHLEQLGLKVVTKNNVVLNKGDGDKRHILSFRKYVMKRDKERIEGSDMLVAEVSKYSHGVGYEHAYAEFLGKPVLLLRHTSLKNQLHSAFLDGSNYNKFMFSFYDEDSIEKILKLFLKKYVKN